MSRLSILFAASEMAPWVKTGGLGDVAAALPQALHDAGHDVRVLLPHYDPLRRAFAQAQPVAELPALAPGLPAARLLGARVAQGPELLLLDCPMLYAGAGNPYLDGYGRDHPDNAARFGLLARVAALLGQSVSPLDWRPDVVHANDWQTALAAAYLHYEGGAASVVTVHNIAFQGCFGHEQLHALGLPQQAWRFDGVEYHGQLSFLKAGLQLATRISTVSPGYAEEIRSEAFGYGLAPLMRWRAGDLRGILNGIDTSAWDPATDPELVQPYDADRIEAKAVNKSALQAELGLEVAADRPLFGIVSRLTQQKGLDLLLEIADRVIALPAQIAVLGSGDDALQDGFAELALRQPGRVAVRLGFDEGLSHRIEAGADTFVMPSRFEPCGLTQLYSLRYGTPPIVRATGGLADTVCDAASGAMANGFVFDDATPQALLSAMVRAARTWRDRDRWRALQRSGMARDSSWGQAARDYIALYREASR